MHIRPEEIIGVIRQPWKKFKKISFEKYQKTNKQQQKTSLIGYGLLQACNIFVAKDIFAVPRENKQHCISLVVKQGIKEKYFI